MIAYEASPTRGLAVLPTNITTSALTCRAAHEHHGRPFKEATAPGSQAKGQLTA